MRKIISKNDRKHFYRLSLYIVLSYVIMFAISLIAAIINYFISKGNNESWIKWTALVLSTVHSLLILINWFALKMQKSKIDYVKGSTFAWLMTIFMDVMSTFCMVNNTLTSLINGGVLSTNVSWILPMMSFITSGISIINFLLELYFLHVAKKSVKVNETL